MADLTGLGDALRRQADACSRFGSPMYEALTRRLVQHLDEHGPVRRVLEPYADAPGPSATGLRLLGSVHRLVLERRARDLAGFYPSVGGKFDLEAAWPAFVAVLDEHADEIGEQMRRPPQTNEVGRAASLTGLLLRLTARRSLPVRLYELGSSAGLNLRADRFRYVGDTGAWGPQASPVLLDPAWHGVATPVDVALDVVERQGCDPDPLDPTSTEGRLVLTSYVWPDQTDRLERLRGAFAVAAEVPAAVHRERAADFVSRLGLREGAWTVLWHSVMWQYLDAEEHAGVQSEIARLGEHASPEAPFAHVFLEPWRRALGAPHEFLALSQAWPGGDLEVLGATPAHGIPVDWER